MSTGRQQEGRGLGRYTRRRGVPFVAAGMATALTVAAIVTSGGGAAGAAADLQAQSVGRFLDGSAGGKPIQAIVDLKDARATSPGTQSDQNRLVLTVGGQGTIDQLNHKLQLPSGGLGSFGAVNQVAVAHPSGYSYGASGAVSNSGGVSVGGNNASYPSNGTLTLGASSFGSSPIPIPGAPAGVPGAAALGDVTASVEGVAGLAKTEVGGDPVTPTYSIADITLGLSSPLIGGVLGQVTSALKSGLAQLTAVTKGALPSECTSPAALTAPQSVGPVTIDPTSGAVTISVAKLLEAAGLDLNKLPANTDLLAYVLNYLSSVNGLTKAVEGTVDSLETSGEARFQTCLDALNASQAAAIVNVLNTLVGQLNGGKGDFETAINSVVTALGAQAAPLSALSDGLKNVLDIGVNVESGPGKAADNTVAPYTSHLKATPDQATPVVDGQTLVRALEIDLLPAAAQSGSTSGDPAAVLALGNAAVGPGVPATTSSPSPLATASNSALPTGVPAGQGTPQHGTPVLPIVLVLLGVILAGGATVGLRTRRRYTH